MATTIWLTEEEPGDAPTGRPPSGDGAVGARDGRRLWLSTLLRRINYVLLAGVASAGVASVSFLDRPLQTLLLKAFVIVFLTLLPGWLYLQFVVVKGDGLYDEYVLNLYRLGIDNVCNLPMPPPASDYWGEWCAQCRDSAAVDPAENVYLRKFESVYGRSAVPDSRRRPPGTADAVVEGGRPSARASSDTFSPVIFATALFCVGWLAVLQPEAFRVVDVFPDIALTGRPDVPVEAMRFGFIGAYAFLLQTVVRRYFRADLKTHFFVSAILRIVVVSLIVVAVAQVWWPTSTDALMAFAFLVGFFPLLGLQLVQQALARILGPMVPVVEERYPLTDLDGLNIWWQARLVEEGVEDMQHLTTANLVELMLHTRMPVTRMVDWIDQAFLYLRVGEHRSRCSERDGSAGADERARLRTYGIRTATDLLDVLDHAELDEGVRAELTTLLPDGYLRLRCVRRTLDGEVNLRHVRTWKQAAWLRRATALLEPDARHPARAGSGS